MNSNGALRPEILPPSITGFIAQKPKTTEEELTDDEKTLASGADKPFWRALRRHFDEQMQVLDEINEQAIAGGMVLEEIGRNALVISQVKGVLKKVVNAVEDAREAQEGGGTK